MPGYGGETVISSPMPFDTIGIIGVERSRSLDEGGNTRVDILIAIFGVMIGITARCCVATGSALRTVAAVRRLALAGSVT